MNIRLKATQYIWTAYTLTMLVVFGSVVATESAVGIGHVVIAIAVSIMAFLSTGAVWSWGDINASEVMIDESADEKRKNRERLEGIIARLSEEEREVLRERLTEEASHYGLSDDGELVRY